MSNEKNENEETQPIVEELEEQLEAHEESEVEEVEDELESLKNEIAALQDKYARVHADFDNIKKRLEREKYYWMHLTVRSKLKMQKRTPRRCWRR